MKPKEEVIKMINRMFGCTTPAYTTDNNNNNSSYTAYPIDALIDEDSDECLARDEWQMIDFEKAPADLDIDMWAQEFSENQIQGFRDNLKNGNLYIASFWNDELGQIKLILWDE